VRHSNQFSAPISSFQQRRSSCTATGCGLDLAEVFIWQERDFPMLTAIAFCLCLASHRGRVVDYGSPHAAMSGVRPAPLVRRPEEELRSAIPQLPSPATTVQSISALKLQRRPSWESTSLEAATYCLHEGIKTVHFWSARLSNIKVRCNLNFPTPRGFKLH
jgi:hypothetical protein